MQWFQSRWLPVAVAAFVSILTLIGAFVGLNGEGAASQDATWQRVQEQHILVVGVEIAFAPYGYVIDDELQGIDPDLATAIGRELDVQIRFVPVNFDSMYDTLFTGEVDMLIAAIRPEPLRLGDFRYSSSYFDAGHVLVGRGDLSYGLQTPEIEQIAVAFASDGDRYIQQEIEDGRVDAEILQLLSTVEVVEALGSNAIDYAVVDSITAAEIQQQYPEINIADDILVADARVIAFRRTDWKLYAEVEQVLEMFRASGELAQLINDWL